MNKIDGTTASRRAFLGGAAATTAGLALAAGCSALAPLAPLAEAAGGLTNGDVDILVAAEIAEALAVTTYTTIIDTAPFFKNLAADDQGYLRAARHEEMSHYLLERNATGKRTPYVEFIYPKGMFIDPRVTLNTLVT